MIKPRQLHRGDTIAVVSPSSGAASRFPHVLDDGLTVLRDYFGFRILEYPTARMGGKELHENPKLRADDINEAFGNPEVKGIIATIGGDDSVRLLQYLDIGRIKTNPKLIMGYSDTTTILSYLNLNGLATYYGSSIMAGFGYLRCFPEAMEEYRKVLLDKTSYEIQPFGSWADGYKPWGEKENAGIVAETRNDDLGHHWINKGKTIRGKLWGGCMEVLEMMKGTFAWPDLDFWNDRILFLETSEDKPSPLQVSYALRNYGIQGILTRISALMLARPKAYSKEEKLELESLVKKVVIGEFGRSDLNIIANADFGHTDPRHIMPYGIDLRLEPESEKMIFVESLFADEPDEPATAAPSHRSP